MILILAASFISPCLFADIGNLFSSADCTGSDNALSPKGLAEMNADWKKMSEARAPPNSKDCSGGSPRICSCKSAGKSTTRSGSGFCFRCFSFFFQIKFYNQTYV